MIRVLGLALYGPLAASTRYRLGQYVDGLAAHGIALEVRHLLGDDYLSRRYHGGAPPMLSLARSSFQRFADLLGQRHFDLAMLYCELFPAMPVWMERLLLRTPYVYDLDDAFYLKYRSGRLAALDFLLGTKIDRILEGAARVTAGSRVLAGYAAERNPGTRYLPTVVDTVRYVPRTAARGTGPFTVGWIGSPSTAPYLKQLAGPLSVLAREAPLRLVVIGGKAPSVAGADVQEIPWSEGGEVDYINSLDCGVMPLPDSDWARGKCAFKLIQYMACAVPVVASPVGANIDVVTADCGRLAETPQQWVDALRELRENPQLRTALGDAGRERVERHYSLRANLPILAEVLVQAAGTR